MTPPNSADHFQLHVELIKFAILKLNALDPLLMQKSPDSPSVNHTPHEEIASTPIHSDVEEAMLNYDATGKRRPDRGATPLLSRLNADPR
jgi:hypothetical protein